MEEANDATGGKMESFLDDCAHDTYLDTMGWEAACALVMGSGIA